MDRLEMIAQTSNPILKGKRVVVTGCGYKPINHIFYDVVTGEPTHDSLSIDGKEMKMNIGTAIAAVLALQGAHVHMVSSSEDKLRKIKDSLISLINDCSLIECSAVNLLDRAQIDSFASELPKDLPLYWVQSLGLGAGSYQVKNDNPYLSLMEISPNLIEAELSVVRATHDMMRAFLPTFKKQVESRVAMISSMSAIRSYANGGVHCSAKGAIDRYANAAMLENFQNKMYVSTVRPGAIDTGMYDSQEVRMTVENIAKSYGCSWSSCGKNMCLAPPTSVAEAVKLILTAQAHIPSLNLVAKGQWPHEGS